MNIEELLQRIDSRLSNLERLVQPSTLSEVLAKSLYSISNVAQLTQTHGIKSYRPYTIRKACSDGRIPDAIKREDGNWVLRREVVQRILENGIPPERRSAS